MDPENAKALDAVRNVKKALLEEISARYPFGKPEPVDSKKVENFLLVVLKWLMLDDSEEEYLLELKERPKKLRITIRRTTVSARRERVGTDVEGALEIKHLLAAWVEGRKR